MAQRAFRKSDLNLNYSSAGDRWPVQAYVRNIENKAVMSNYGPPFADCGATVNPALPRTAGLRLAAYF